MKSLKNTDRGVSPVIGVVLMVAITVILAAVLNQYLLTIPGLLSTPAQAGMTISEEPMPGPEKESRVTVLLTSMQNTDRVIIRVESSQNIPGNCYDTRLTQVGQQEKIPKETADSSCSTGLVKGDKIIMVGVNDNGDRSVIQTHTVG